MPVYLKRRCNRLFLAEPDKGDNPMPINLNTNIEWTNGTLNPITGGCTPAGAKKPMCDYCYAWTIANNGFYRRAFPNRFDPTFHPERLDDLRKLKRPSLIFMDSMGDMFGGFVNPDWVTECFDAMSVYKQHIYQILTKNPERIHKILYGDEGKYYLGGGDYYSHIWLGVTVDRFKALGRIDALRTLKYAYGCGGWNIFASFEPMMEHIPKKELYKYLEHLDWLIIGQRTKPFNNPPLEWIHEVVDAAEMFKVPVFVKNNLIDEGYYPVEYREQYQKFPPKMCDLLKEGQKYDRM
jgi:protein gp37